MESNDFTLHPQLAADTLVVGDMPICRVLLMNERQLPWLLLVPRRVVCRDLTDVPELDYGPMMDEVKQVHDVLKQGLGPFARPDKMNVGALGNMVPQLHIHILGRYRADPAWPKPVWGNLAPAQHYTPAVAAAVIEELKAKLGLT